VMHSLPVRPSQFSGGAKRAPTTIEGLQQLLSASTSSGHSVAVVVMCLTRRVCEANFSRRAS